MITTTLSKVGNSMAVLLPKALRTQAGIYPDELLVLDSPRKGVVVITAMVSDEEDRLDRLDEIEKKISARKRQVREWPQGMTANDLLRAGKDKRAHELPLV